MKMLMLDRVRSKVFLYLAEHYETGVPWRDPSFSGLSMPGRRGKSRRIVFGQMVYAPKAFSTTHYASIPGRSWLRFDG